MVHHAKGFLYRKKIKPVDEIGMFEIDENIVKFQDSSKLINNFVNDWCGSLSGLH